MSRAQWIALATLVAVALAAVCSVPHILALADGTVPYGHDADFHLARIESISRGLADGCLPVRLYPSMAWGMGYPCGVCYPDALLYPAAALHLAGMPLACCYDLLFVAGNLLAAAVAIPSFARVSGSRGCGLACATLWVLSPYRLFDVLVRASVGEWLALAFMPLALCGAWSLRQAGERGRDDGYLLLGIGMAGILCSHVLSVPLMIPICVAFAAQGLVERPGNRAAQLAAAGKSVIVATILSLAFAVPFFSYYTTHDLYVQHVRNTPWEKVLSPGQLLSAFVPFRSIIDKSLPGGGLPHEVGLALLLALPAAVVAVVAHLVLGGRGDGDGDDRSETCSGAGCVAMVAVLSVALMLATTDALPWAECGHEGPVGTVMRLAGAMQFPWRLVGQASLCLTLLWGLVARCGGRGLRALCLAATALAVIEGAYAVGSYMGMACAYGEYGQAEQSHISNGEYLPAGIGLEGEFRRGRLMEGGPVASDGRLSVEMGATSAQRFEALVDNPSPDAQDALLPVLWHDQLVATAEADSVIDAGGLLVEGVAAGGADETDGTQGETTDLADNATDDATGNTTGSNASGDGEAGDATGSNASGDGEAGDATGGTDGREGQVSIADDGGYVRLSVPAGFCGRVTLEFVEPPAWRAAEVVSAAGAVCAACLLALEARRRREAA